MLFLLLLLFCNITHFLNTARHLKQKNILKKAIIKPIDSTPAPCRHGGQGSAISDTTRGPHFSSSLRAIERAGMSSLRRPVRGLGIYDCGSLFPFLLLDEKEPRIKADIKGPPHMATAPPPCRPGPRAQPGRSLAFPSTVSVVLTFTLDDTPPPLAVIDSLRIVESGICGLDPRSPMLLGHTPCRRFASSRGGTT